MEQQYKQQFKKCSRCKEYKHISKFSSNKSKKDGLNNECKNCANISQRKSNPKNLNELELIQRKCKRFANNKDIAIQHLLQLADIINEFIDKYELEWDGLN